VAVTDLDEWLRADVDHDEVTLTVDDAGLVLRASLVVRPEGRQVSLAATADGTRASHEAREAGPPTANWDRMLIGGVEWRMVEPLRAWELTADDPEAGLRIYLAFVGSSPCVARTDGYEQVGTVAGQVQMGDRRVTVTHAPARRTHTWGEATREHLRIYWRGFGPPPC